jgi:hypothetical protein
MLRYLQPLFPGESGVDQLVEIIKVNFCVRVLLLYQVLLENCFILVFGSTI